MMAREHPRPDEDTDWQTQAACRGLDPDLFHPHTLAWYGPSKQRSKVEQTQIAKAKATCATCPVGDDCEADHPSDELVALHGPSTETLSDHLDRWEADSGGLTRHLAEVHGIDSPFERPPFDAGGWEHLDSLHRHAHAGDADA